MAFKSRRKHKTVRNTKYGYQGKRSRNWKRGIKRKPRTTVKRVRVRR